MKKNIRELVGKRLKSIRAARKLTQETLAEKANLHSKYISSLECGRENPTLDVFLKLSEALDVELTDIFSFEHESDNTQDLKKAIDELLYNAQPEKLKTALKLLKAIFR
jgi:transcriptional regulator with XRE-family HTH domain